MNINNFSYQGKEYQIDKVDELEPYLGNRRIQVTTKCHKKFQLTFKESVYQWVISELPIPKDQEPPNPEHA